MFDFVPEKYRRVLRIAQSNIAATAFKNPGGSLKLIGVTGTSGKSTTSTMIYNMLKEAGKKVGLISTVAAYIGDDSLDTGFHVTTPDPIALQKYLKKMRDSGMEYVVIETSSHALEQGRIGNLKFDVAVFTNIKRDHLDWHRTWENYVRAKVRLIDSLKENGVAIFNSDDSDSAKYIREYLDLNRRDVRPIEYSSKDEIGKVSESKNGIEFLYSDTQFTLLILGKYNAENALATIKVGESLDISKAKIAKSFKSFEGLPGRMEVMQKDPYMIIVDFAHNTDSLEKSLKAARKLVGSRGRLITIFGSAGLRDVEKRFTMGKSSGELADITIITAEDPRTESLYEINSRIIQGAESSGATLVKRFKDGSEMKKYLKELDIEHFRNQDIRFIFSFDEENVDSRFDAVKFAIQIAGSGDVIITEGKGHEKSLCFGTTEYPFTDQEAVRKALGE